MAKSANTPEKKRKAPRSAWKPGVSGNPRGRPSAGMSWAELIIQVGNEPMPGNPDMTWKEQVVRAAFVHAMKGNAQILRELWQRSEPQPTEVTVHHDWREEARARGLSEADVLAEVEAILRENEAKNDDESHRRDGDQPVG